MAPAADYRDQPPADAGDLVPLLRSGLAAMHITTSQRQLDQLAAYIQLLARWNRAYNLTAVREPQAMVPLHILDSMTARPALAGVSVLDAGTGAGLPGIPLAIIEPDRQFTLLDSGGKKIRFLRHALAELGIANARPEEARAERFQPGQAFDTVICRAFTQLRGFVERCGGLVASGGRLVAMKGRLPQDELDVLPDGWAVAGITPVSVPGLDAQRHIIVLERAQAR